MAIENGKSLEQKAAEGVEAISMIVRERDELRAQLDLVTRDVQRLRGENDTMQRFELRLVHERDHYMRQAMELMQQMNNLRSICNSAVEESRAVYNNRPVVDAGGLSTSFDIEKEMAAAMPKFIERIRNGDHS